MDIRLAKVEEIEDIRTLIRASAVVLQLEFYPLKIIEEARELVTGIPEMLIGQTLFVAKSEGNIIASGGYKCIEPERAELKAFFVHPEYAKQGLASAILSRCIESLRYEKVKEINLVSTLAGEKFYKKRGFVESSRKNIRLSSGSIFEVVNMSRVL